MRRAGGSGALLLVCLLAAGVVCPPASATPEGVATQTYGQAPVWGGCQQWVADTSAIPTAQCGTVTVPVDYAKPEGAQAQLAVIRIPASGDRIGVLMVNPGGPGASAVDTVAGMGAALADTEIGRRFDLVGFDPRGVGHSTPELRCRTDAEFDAFRREPNADYSQAGVAHIEDLYRDFAQKCVDRIGAEFLANVGTASTAHDMDVVRAALGENQVSYLGYSYGTEIGAAYGAAYPRADPGHGARRRDRSDAGPDRGESAPNGRFPKGFRGLRRRLRAVGGVSARHRPDTVRQPVSPADRPVGDAARRNVGSPRLELSGRHHRHRQRPLLASVLEVPHQRPARVAAQDRPG